MSERNPMDEVDLLGDLWRSPRLAPMALGVGQALTVLGMLATVLIGAAMIARTVATENIGLAVGLLVLIPVNLLYGIAMLVVFSFVRDRIGSGRTRKGASRTRRS